ncbi:MAG: MFS transporter [Armatimonadota bacterium]
MKSSRSISTRSYSFLLPALMDGMLGLVLTSLPLLAIRFGASAWFLGMLGWIPQAARLPFCSLSGRLSDKIGRTRVILPAVGFALLACLGLTLVKNNTQALIVNIFLLISVGMFYPSLQALIGDHSPRGELRKNLSFFNMGWTVGGSVCGLAAGYLFAARVGLPFLGGAVLLCALIVLVVKWSREPITGAFEADSTSTQADDSPGALLFIARTGHFLGFFGYSLIRNIFPKLATDLHMSEGSIGLVIGMILVGQATGMFISSAGPWWRGKLWPLILSQSMMLIAGTAIFFTDSKLLFGAAFFLQGMSLGISYTGALYYGLQARTNMGRSTGIHESLVASAIILGSLMGGTTAQFISLRAPYITFACIAAVAITTSLIIWHRSKSVSLDL